MTADTAPWVLGMLIGNLIGLALGYRIGFLASEQLFRQRFRRYRGTRRKRSCTGGNA